MKTLRLIIVCEFFLMTSMLMFNFFPCASAEIQLITVEGEYSMGEAETINFAQSQALLDAKRNALERAGTYLESLTEVKNLQVTKDEIKAVTGHFMEFQGTPQFVTSTVSNLGLQVKVHVSALVDTDSITENLRDKKTVTDYKDAYLKLQKQYEEIQAQVKQQDERYKNASTAAEKEEIKKAARAEEQKYEAVQWFEKGWLSETETAKPYLTKAIELDPTYADAYYWRGVVQTDLKLKIADFSKAIELTQNNEQYYIDRGSVYRELELYDKALDDYSKAISLNPRNTCAYTYRGSTYSALKQYDQAIAEYTQVLSINPDDAYVYHSRSTEYYWKHDYEAAKNDSRMAIKLAPKNAQFKNGLKNIYRDWITQYRKEKNYSEALNICNQYINDFPQDETAYLYRGDVYRDLENKALARNDYKTAIALEKDAYRRNEYQERINHL